MKKLHESHPGELLRLELEDGRLAIVAPLTFGAARLGVCEVADLNLTTGCPAGYADVWDFLHAGQAFIGAAGWNPHEHSEPELWIRHLRTGRRMREPFRWIGPNFFNERTVPYGR